MGLMPGHRNSNAEEHGPIHVVVHKKKRWNPGDDALTTALSCLYAKLLFVLGIAFPVTEVLSPAVPANYYQSYYLFLYIGSISFMCVMYMTLLKERAVHNIIRTHGSEKQMSKSKKATETPIIRYGSFYLRLGAIAFGVGSMVYSGLEFAQYFELKGESQCHNVLQILTPGARLVLTLVQMQFIFLNSQDMKMSKYRVLARFGLMHMVATNLCEWLYVLVEETKHEIVHLGDHARHEGAAAVGGESSSSEESSEEQLGGLLAAVLNATALRRQQQQHRVSERGAHDIYECRRANIMGSLVQNASPFLFPCTIEYSLICAVILYEMWKHIGPDVPRRARQLGDAERGAFKVTTEPHQSLHHFTVDCTSAHKGLFSGVLVLVFTIISLILFFVLNNDPKYKYAAVFEVNVCELVLYIVCTVAVLLCMAQLRGLKYEKTSGHGGGGGLGLDNSLLVMAQSGVYVYCMFSIIGSQFADDDDSSSSAASATAVEVCSLVQTTVQTILVLDASGRRCRTSLEARRKPGRQIITFLMVANMAMWAVNTLEKGHAEFRPSHLRFFGIWAWTIITHISMPLAIFYRFHSTICLFEVWKCCYKIKT
ncbi:proton channel OtopLc-like [Bacillus rossius redtenbacheri]|uniref:proton channel OtopLc-like n=1 Tax=Bacillus rossius redtenbacheri TaxID=93214 RepID=UPI002FDDAA0A